MKIYKTATGKSVVVNQQAVSAAKIAITGINAAKKAASPHFQEPSGVLIGKSNLSNKLRIKASSGTIQKIFKKIA